MKVLFIAPYVPNRIRVRPFSIIRELGKRHEVHVVALAEGEGTGVCGIDEVTSATASFNVVPHSRLRGFAQSLVSLPTNYPMCTAFCWSGPMGRIVRDMLERQEFDVVHVEHLRAAHFAPRSCQIPVVFDSVDCLAGLFRQMAGSKRNPVGKLVMIEEAWKLRRYEPRMLRRFDRIIITSESEREELVRLDETLRIDVIPNGVDTDYFAPQGVQKFPNRIIFSGKMSYNPNSQAVLWFAREVLPAVRAQRPDAEFVIAGSSPPPDVQKLAEEPGVSVTGYVDDLRQYLESAAVAVVPMQVAVGIQNKVLEAMAMQLPVVASPAAVRPFGPGCPGIIEAADARETAAAVLRLLSDKDLALELGRNARQEVLRNFSWQSSVNRLEEVYDEAATMRVAARGGRIGR